MGTIEQDHEFVAGCYRVVTAWDRAYRAGLDNGRSNKACRPKAYWDGTNVSLLDAYRQGHAAARWEVENSLILG